jgi:hypothetical protein
VTVGEGDSVTVVSGPAFSAQATVPANDVTTATFDDSIPQLASDFTAMIDWGDGMTSTGTVSGGGGSPLVVRGTHTYAVAGAVTVKTALTDDPPGTTHVIASGTLLVAPPPTTDGGTGGTGGGGSSGTGCGAAPLPWFLPAAWLLGRRRRED